MEALTRGIVAKLLHDPTVNVKDGAGTPSGEQLAQAPAAAVRPRHLTPGCSRLRIATRGSALARWQAEEVGRAAAVRRTRR